MHSQQRELIQRDIVTFLKEHEEKELLRFVAVGSVDDGKSTLIGRLLHDTRSVYDDQLSAVRKSSKQQGTEIDFSLFTDGLKAEREQGITIDVAYRYFSTPKRKFIIADTPGHVQYTRNMATGASTAQVAIILIDARLGVLQQSRRHAYIASLLGIPRLAVCINKMDLVDFDESVYERIKGDFDKVLAQLPFGTVQYFPISALAGDNVVDRSTRTPYFPGPTLLEFLETVPVGDDSLSGALRYPVQYVLRPHLDYRGFAGQIASGTVRKGDEIVALPSGRRSRVAAVDGPDGPLEVAFAPMSVTLRLEDEIDISRGEMLAPVEQAPVTTQRLEASLVWMHESKLDLAKTYLLKQTSRVVRANLKKVVSVVDLDTLGETDADTLAVNDIATVEIATHQPLFVDPYRENRTTGSFILIDPVDNQTVAAGMIREASASSSDEASADASEVVGSRVSADERQRRLRQKGTCIEAKSLSQAWMLERLLTDAGQTAVVVRIDELSKEAVLAVVQHALAAELLVILAGEAAAMQQLRAAILSKSGQAEAWHTVDDPGHRAQDMVSEVNRLRRKALLSG